LENQEKYSELTAKYLAGQANAAEEQELLAWADADPQHQHCFEEWSQAWAMAESAPTSPFEADLEAAWAKVDAAISQERTLYQERPTAKIVRFTHTMRQWSVAAAVLVGVAALAWWLHQPRVSEAQFVEVQTFAHEKKKVTLPDSSQVWLNENSKLTYAPKFERRQVNLEGEAFFEVEQIVERPFEISTGAATTTVLGTSFNVRAYPAEEKIEVTVKTGKVALAVTERKETTILLASGETGVMDKKLEKVEIAVHEQENADAWKTQKFAFDDEKLAQVIGTLQRYFDVEIQVANQALLECPYTSSFEVQGDQLSDLENILTVIGTTIGFGFSKTEGRYLLSGKGCL
jgi:ferric-dicitrate binding protein FerR (iron transport regulator)